MKTKKNEFLLIYFIYFCTTETKIKQNKCRSDILPIKIYYTDYIRGLLFKTSPINQNIVFQEREKTVSFSLFKKLRWYCISTAFVLNYTALQVCEIASITAS